MTVATTNSTQSFAGAQSALTYSFYSIPNHPEFLNVTLRETSTGTETELTYNSDFTVTQSTSGLGGTVHVIPSYGSGYTQLVWRDTTQTQSSDYDDFNQFPADTLEKDLDRLMCLAQEQQGEIDRAIKNDITSPTALTYAMINSVASTAITASVLAGNYATSAGTSATESEAARDESIAAATASTAAQTAAVAAATAATVQATTASTQATLAGNYATSSSTSATLAGNYATSASTQVNLATTQSTLAGNYASTASTQATLAGNYATSASTSATLADNYATTSGTSATLAGNYATSASTSATEASNYATTASTQATLAGNYATTCSTIADQLPTANIQYVIDGGGIEIETGIHGDLEIPFNCTIGTSTLLSTTTGSIVIDIWKDTYANFPPTNADSITASAAPSISSAAVSQDTTLSGWTTSIESGSTLRFNVDSVTDLTKVTLSLEVERAS